MKTIKILSLLAIVFSLTLTSCDDFGDINDNPDVPTTAEPQFILTNAIYKIGDQTAVNGFTYNGAIMQHFGMYLIQNLYYQIQKHLQLLILYL